MQNAICQIIGSIDTAERLALNRIVYDGEAVTFDFAARSEGGVSQSSQVERWLERHGEP